MNCDDEHEAGRLDWAKPNSALQAIPIGASVSEQGEAPIAFSSYAD